jgi:CRP-like cAMP-binding protein
MFRRGEVVFHEHDPADSLHLVTRGWFGVQARTRLGDEVMIAVRGEGDVFGEMALLTDSPRSATVFALEPGETLAVYRREFEVLRTRHPAIERAFTTMLTHAVRRMDRLLAEAYYESAEVRVLRRLIELAELYGGEDARIEVPLTQEQLAAIAGTSRATVNAVLAAERRRGSVSLARGRTIVTDVGLLRRRAGVGRD